MGHCLLIYSSDSEHADKRPAIAKSRGKEGHSHVYKRGLALLVVFPCFAVAALGLSLAEACMM